MCYMYSKINSYMYIVHVHMYMYTVHVHKHMYTTFSTSDALEAKPKWRNDLQFYPLRHVMYATVYDVQTIHCTRKAQNMLPI